MNLINANEFNKNKIYNFIFKTSSSTIYKKYCND